MTHAGGITFDGGAVDNLVGGTAAGAANLVTLTLVSVQVGEFNGTSRGNAILGNSMFSNEVLGINLGYDNVTPHDRVDADSGPNDLQNFPVLTSAATNGSEVEVAGRLGGAAGAQFRTELFANDSCNRFGSGEGQLYLGSVDATTDGTAVAEYAARFAVEEVPGGSITATATSAGGSTSEFSLCVELALSWQPPDAASTASEPPPRDLSATLASRLGAPDPVAALLGRVGSGPRGNPVTGYKVYRSNAPNVQPTPANFFTSVPPTTTAAGAGVFAGGTFFVVTATYPTGESGPSNEVETGVPPTITSLKATGSKVTAKGSGFTSDVLVTVDGIPFQSPAVVKSGNRKVVQRGVLITGETLGDYARSRGMVSILVRNSTGGIAGSRVSVPR
jgi:hypothetical protein